MFRVAILLTLLGCALPSQAQGKKVTIRFLGGAKKAPLDGLHVTIRRSTGDWTADLLRKVADGKTDKSGAIDFNLGDGDYYVDLVSEKERPYLSLPMGYKGRPSHYSRRIRVGKELAFEFNLADPCKLILRAVDADTGKGLPGAVFVTCNDLAEDWEAWIHGDQLGAKGVPAGREEDTLKTDADGNFVRLMAPHPGYSYFVWKAPPGYAVPDNRGEVELKTPIGTDKVEHTFRFKKK